MSTRSFLSRRASKAEVTEGFFVVMASPEDVLLHKVYPVRMPRMHRDGSKIVRRFFKWVIMPRVKSDRVYWSHLMPSERQIRDAQGIVAVQGSRLDMQYIEEWAGEMGIEEEIKALLAGRNLPNLT